MTPVTPTEAAWMAGFIDGEGCLTITRQIRKGRPSPAYRGTVNVSNTKLEPLRFFMERYGGGIYNIHERRNGKTCPEWSDAYDWHCPISSLLRLLTDIQPYLQVKAEQSRLLIEFLNTKHGFRRGPRPAGKHGGSAPLLPDEIEHRENLRSAVHVLNKRGKVA